ncbi:MAG: hypothetical protein OEU44_04490, partial [Gammaproteobacteria bacterium]|nr:hypothetical protein [Gammaproteobacteria bacterium]
MLSELKTIQTRFTALIITGLLLAPIAGLVSAVLFGLITPEELGDPQTAAILASFVLGTTLWSYAYFSSFF